MFLNQHISDNKVPYNEHNIFSELKEFAKVVSPVNIILGVINHGPESRRAMISPLLDWSIWHQIAVILCILHCATEYSIWFQLFNIEYGS